MSRMLLMMAAVSFAGCGSGHPSETPKYDNDAQGCVLADAEATFEARLESCLDAACSGFDSSVWFADLWRLAGCEGPAAPASASIELELNAERMPGLVGGDEVRVGVHWRRSPYGYTDHRSWSLRAPDGGLLLLHASGDSGHLGEVGPGAKYWAVVESASHAENLQGILAGWSRFRILVVSEARGG